MRIVARLLRAGQPSALGTERFEHGPLHRTGPSLVDCIHTIPPRQRAELGVVVRVPRRRVDQCARVRRREPREQRGRDRGINEIMEFDEEVSFAEPGRSGGIQQADLCSLNVNYHERSADDERAELPGGALAADVYPIGNLIQLRETTAGPLRVRVDVKRPHLGVVGRAGDGERGPVCDEATSEAGTPQDRRGTVRR